MGLNKEQDRLIAQLYSDMYYSLSAYALSALNDHSLAEEAVQDTFRIASQKVDDLASSENPKGWLVNTLKYVIRNTRRSLSRLNNLVISSLSFDENTALSYDDMDVDVMYSDLLGNGDYTLLKLIVLHKYTMLEAAEELGISVEACKKRVQRAKNKLRKLLENK